MQDNMKDTVPMPLEPERLQVRSPAGVLLVLAALAWLVSLAAPGFMLAHQTEPWLGVGIAGAGLVFGWAVGGWAAYANLFFLYAARKLSMGTTTPVAVCCMLLLAITLPAFRGVTDSSASTNITSWGWGCALWLASLGLLALAQALQAKSLSPAIVGVACVLMVCAVAWTARIGHGQRQRANAQELEALLPPQMLFTTAEIRGAPFAWPAAPLVSSIDEVSIDDGRPSTSPMPTVYVPYTGMSRIDGADWIVYPGRQPDEGFRVRSMAPPRPFVLELRYAQDSAAVRLLDTRSGLAVYSQQLNILRHSGSVIGVDPPLHPALGGKLAVQEAIQTAIAYRPTAMVKPVVLSEEGRVPCNFEERADGETGAGTWAGHEVVMASAARRALPAFCSKSYVGMVYLRMQDPKDGGARRHVPQLQLYDRASLKPAGRFVNKFFCGPDCVPADDIKVTGFRVSAKGAVLETTAGEIPASVRFD